VAALGEQLREPPDVDDLVGGLEPGVREALELGNPPVQRHLAALERGRHLRARLGALGAAARGLALGRLTAPHPGTCGARARSRPQVMQLQARTGRAALLRCHGQSTSSSATMWRTAAIMS